MDIAAAADRVALFRELPTDEREKLLANARIVEVDDGDALWCERDDPNDFFFLLWGRIMLSRKIAGSALLTDKRVTVEIPDTGELLCAGAVYAGRSLCCAGVSQDGPTGLLAIPRDDLIASMERCKVTMHAFIGQLANRCMNVCDRVQDLSSGPLARRVAKMLLKLSERVGIDRGNGEIRIPIPLSRQDIAELCGTTTETAIRLMSRFDKSNWVKKAERGLILINPKALRAVANGDGEME